MTLSLRQKHHIYATILLTVVGQGSIAMAENINTAPVVKYLDAQEAKSLLETNPNIQTLDVRTKGEFNRGHIQGAIHVNYFSPKFKKKLRTLDRLTSYLVHCKSGHRSNRAVKIMQREGFQKIYHLDGGYDAWKKIVP